MASPSFLLRSLSILTILHLSAAGIGGFSSFISSYCTATRYPDLCVQSLSVYAATIKQSPRLLAQTALSVSLTRAQETKSFIAKLGRFKGLKPREYAAITDCAEEIDETVSRLARSVDEMKRAGDSKSPEFGWRMSNVETWVSTAITTENTCSDGFAGKGLNGPVKTSMNARIVNVGRLTSNALALIHKFASQS